MKHLLNTLYVTTQGSYLSRDGETVLIRVEKETRLRLPIHTLAGIVCFGQVSCSPPLMELCAEHKVYLSFLSEHGKFMARVQGPVSGNVLLRRVQYRCADDPEKITDIAKSVVIGKIANCRKVLMRSLRERSDNEGVQALNGACDSLSRILRQLSIPMTIEEIRGKEGEAARTYFSVFDYLIVVNKEEFYFRERNRRPPLDNMNALLSFFYTLLAHDVASALESVGLDPAVGYLHTDRPGRPGLALDMMEEFRPFLADRLTLSLVNRQQLKSKDFKKSETGAVVLGDDARKEVLIAYQNRKKEEIHHPFIGEKVAIGLLPYIQAQLLARYLRKDLDGYPPFVWK